MRKLEPRPMKKIVYILSNQIPHFHFFSNFLGFDYECYELDPIEVELSDFKKYIMNLIIINDRAVTSSLYTILRTLRNSQDLAKTPIIIITNRLRKSYHKKLIKAGATAILHDPIDPDEARIALKESHRFHQVVEKTSQIHAPNLTEIDRPLLDKQAVTDVHMYEKINNSFLKHKTMSLVFAQIVLLRQEKITTSNLDEIQKAISQSLNEKTLTFLSSNEFFFVVNKDAKETKSICQRIKDELSLKYIGISFGIACKTQESEAKNIQDYLLLAKKHLSQALKHPNSIVM